MLHIQLQMRVWNMHFDLADVFVASFVHESTSSGLHLVPCVRYAIAVRNMETFSFDYML